MAGLLKSSAPDISGRLAFCLVAGFGVLAMLPAYYWGIPAGADLDNHFRFVMPFYDELGRGNLIPGWLAESNFGFGDPRFRFYPPFLYYILALARFATGDWYYATFVVFTLFSVAGAFGVYTWSRQNLSRRTSVLAGLIFAFVPYHLTQFYQASLLAEFAATSMLPFAFLFVEKLSRPNSRGRNELMTNVAGLGLSFALIILTHLPTTVIASISLAIYAGLLTDWRENKRGLVFAALGILLGAWLSSWFWVKMLSELSWIQAGEKIQSAYYDYRNNFLFSPFSIPNRNVWFGGIVAALTLGLLSPAVALMRALFSPRSEFDTELLNIPWLVARRSLRVAILIGLFALLMTSDLSRPIWAVVPKIKDIQFPYRWLTILSTVICPAAALSIQLWVKRVREGNIRPLHLIVLIVFAVSIFFTVRELIVYSDFVDHETFLARIQEVRGARSFNDWLPVGAAELKDIEHLEGQIDTRSRDLVSGDWQTHKRKFSLAPGPATQVRLRSYFYPLWKATVVSGERSRPGAISAAADGTLLVDVPAEACDVEVAFTEPTRTMISIIVSAIGWTGILGFLLLRKLF